MKQKEQIMSDCYFATFTYPYTNGPLHLGHLYTMLKQWANVRWNQHRHGGHTFAPFAFHCTGMPISASASKLAKGDETVKKMLQDIGVEDTTPFHDPGHWIEYFTEMGMNTMRGLRLPGIDMGSTFVTTERNPYYDSFIRWQFSVLKDNDMVSYEERPCIYSPSEGQPCFDHDRQSGEGVVPVKCRLYLKNEKWVLEPIDERYRNGFQCSLFTGIASGNPYMIQSPNRQTCVIVQNTLTPVVKRSLLQQHFTIHPIVDPVDQYGSLEFYLPHRPVVSRNGHECIVAYSYQWYLKYSDPIWKTQVMDWLSKNPELVDQSDVQQQIKNSVRDMQDWCFSRELGLGTRIPWDRKFVIDSLSDSTIYPLYYYLRPMLHLDIYGDQPHPLAPKPSEMTPEFWNNVFRTIPSSSLLLSQMPSRMALRVSGRDLITNHLTMLLFQGVFFTNYIRHQVPLLPLRYSVNGYLTIDGKKMSKSTGNFITIDEALKKYSTQALVISLLEVGDNSNDANLQLNGIKKTGETWEITNSLLNETETNSGAPEASKDSGLWKNLALRCYKEIIMECYEEGIKSMDKGRFKEGLSYCWRKAWKAYNKYGKVDNTIDQWCLDLIKYVTKPFCLSEPDVLKKTDLLVPDWPRDPLAIKIETFLSQTEKAKNSAKNIKVSISLLEQDDTIEEHLLLQGWLLEIDYTPIDHRRDPFKVKPQYY
jgi:leucyl-tRNA synthetase